jgi:hypothetical protein
VNRTRFLLLLPVWLLAAFLLAFPLRDIVNQLVIQPVLYLFWMLGLVYRAIPQVVLWAALIAIMLLLAASFVVKNISFSRLRPRRKTPQPGPVQVLAYTIQRKSGGVYFNWQVARSLSEIALGLQELRAHTGSRSLRFDESDVAPEVRRYLDAGLNTSFSDYPMPAFFKPRPKTPFDVELDPVLDYLESQTEIDK